MGWLSGAVMLLVLAMSATARAQPGLDASDPAVSDLATADADAIASDTSEAAAKQEIGAYAGVGLGGRTTPGGLHLGGNYLYRLSRLDWFEGGVGFEFGGGNSACFTDRTGAMLCNHGTFEGFGAGLSVGIRRFFTAKQQFTPYVHGGVALRVASFGGDEVTGIAAPVWLGGGVRARVHDGIAVVGGGRLLVGPAWFGGRLRAEPFVALQIYAGVEFALD